MRVHVLAGCHQLLRPTILTPEEAAGLIGPHVRTAPVSWLPPNCGNNYHAILQDEPGDRRTSVLASALKDGFGTRFEPLLVLADLFNEIEPQGQRGSPVEASNRRSQRTVLSEISANIHLRQLRLYGVALPAKADPEGSWAVPAGIVPGAVRNRIEKLRTLSMADVGSDAVETRVIEATPDLPVFGTLYNNAVCNELALRLAPLLREQGWISDVEILPRTIVGILADLSENGVSPALPLRADDLDTMTRLICEKLF